MLKKLAHMLLGFNLLTLKPVIAFEPLFTGMAVSYASSKVVLSVVTCSYLLTNKIQSQKEDDSENAEYLFWRCLTKNKVSTHLNAIGIPVECDSAEKICRLLAGNIKTDVIIAAFKAEKAAEAFRSRMGKASAVIVAGQLMRPYVAPTEEENLQKSIKRNYDIYVQSEKELIICMDRHAYPDRTIVPKVCEEIALKYYLHATGKNYYEELMKKNNAG